MAPVTHLLRGLLPAPVLAAVLAVGLSVSLGGCVGAARIECATNADCGELEACNEDGECEDVQCLSSSDCDIYQYCDDDDYECRDGCADDTDCMAGETCDPDSHECSAYGCRSTQLDCEYGQFCDQVTGTCYDDERPHCASCDAATGAGCSSGQCLVSATANQCNTAYNGSDCPQGMDCGVFDYDESSFCWSNSDCSNGWYCDQSYFVCYLAYCYESSCFQNCSVSDGDEACPRGFQCIDVFQDGSSAVCIGECDFMTEGGYL